MRKPKTLQDICWQQSIAHILELILPERWNHVSGAENPADCASRGLLPSELIKHKLWWNGPSWLKNDQSEWPRQTTFQESIPTEEKEICLLTITQQKTPIIPLDQYSTFAKLKRGYCDLSATPQRSQLKLLRI